MSLATKYTLKPALQAKFNGIIWKVVTDPVSSVIAIETRDPKNRTANFSAFNFDTGITFFKEISVQDSWNWGLDKACHGFVYLHSYLNEKTPEHKAIIAINESGYIAWEVYNRTLDNVSADGLIVYNPTVQQKRFELLNPASGVIENNHIDNPQFLSRNIYFPETTSNPSFLKRAMEKGTLVGSLYFLDHNGKECLSFHAVKDAILSLYLLIIDKGSLIHEEILEHNIQKLNPEPFYIEQDHLFCIRNNKQEIVSYLV